MPAKAEHPGTTAGEIAFREDVDNSTPNYYIFKGSLRPTGVVGDIRSTVNFLFFDEVNGQQGKEILYSMFTLKI